MLSPELHSQEWQRVGGDFHAAEITPGGTIVFVGEFGTILLSEDEGTTWLRPQTGTWKTLRSIRFRDSLHGFAGGDSGVFLRTDDGGRSWQTLNVQEPGPIRDIEFPSGVIGFALVDSGTLMRTMDGGEHWRKLSALVPAYVDDMSFVSDSVGYAATSNGSIYRTEDGGIEWARVFEDSSLCLTGIAVGSGESSGYACSFERRIIATTDGGDHWSEVGTVDSGLAPLSIAVSASGELYVCGERERFDADPKPAGLLGVSRDSGASWERLEPFRVPLSNAAEAIGYKSVSIRRGRIAYAGNAGAIMVNESLKNQSWMGVSSTMSEFPKQGQSYAMYRVAFSDGDSGIASVFDWGGDYTRYFRTFDGGATWHFRFNSEDQSYLNLFPFPDGEWLAFVHQSGILERSTDGGTIWLRYNPATLEPRPALVRDGTFVNRKNGFVATDAVYSGVGLRPALFRTTDGGESWELAAMQGVDPFDVFIRVSFPTVQTGYVVGSRGTGGHYAFDIVKTSDGGDTWKNVLSLSRDDNISVGLYFVNESNGFLVEGRGDSTGAVFSTDDDGETWDSIRIGEGSPRNVKFFDQMNGFILGFPSMLLRTTDGGKSWNHEELWPPESDTSLTWFEDISLMPDERTVVLIGYGVIARKTYAEKLVSVPTERNPKTPTGTLTITPNPTADQVRLMWHSIETERAVQVRLFDVLGREVPRRTIPIAPSGVAELDVSRLPAGTYRAVVEGKEGDVLAVRSVVIIR